MTRKRLAILVVFGIAAGCVDNRSDIVLTPALDRDPAEFAALQTHYDGNIYPFFDEFCFRCHGDKREEGGVNLFEAPHVSNIGENPAMWNRVLSMLESGQMPPPDQRRLPDAADRAEIAAFVERELDQSVLAMRPDPGRVTAKRLNRQEYDNTVRDLLGVASNPARAFPVDDSGYGFDNIGDVLTISPLLMEKYLSAAESIAWEAIEADLAYFEDQDSEDEADGYEPQVFLCGHEPGEHARDCEKSILRDIASRAYRRPVTRHELSDLTDLVDLVVKEGDGFEAGVALALQAILVSPNFLFTVERDQRPDDPDALRYVNDYELASRLSYFLWSSMPDGELFAKAEEGTLREPAVLSAQVERMIQDDKAWEFVANFAGQWLELRNLDLVRRDRDIYPDFNGELRNAMAKESELFFDDVFRQNRSVLNFLDSDFTYVNERLAQHYGLEGIEGKEHRRVTLDGIQRGGVLTHGSVLTLTSFPTRTSPVVRGAWVLENILGTPPPPPPEDVPALEDDPGKLTGTLREQLEKHRADASCASCHARIDPLGFGLENYDATGRWRTVEREDVPVDSSGVLPNGQAFEGSKELRAILMADPGPFVRNFTEKLLTYALGRGVAPYDRPVVAEIVDCVAEDDYRFHTLIHEIVASVPFQMRRGEGVPES